MFTLLTSPVGGIVPVEVSSNTAGASIDATVLPPKTTLKNTVVLSFKILDKT